MSNETIRTIAQSDEGLIQVNEAIEKALKQYMTVADSHGSSLTIRFDVPESNEPPDGPTVCVFLYDIHEDLELRHGRARQYDAIAGTFAAREVQLRCCYLLTYWEKDPTGDIGPDAQHIQVMNQALNALLNMQLPAFIRVVQPSEHLSSLGSFWQALGDKPRLCLTFSVTIPVKLGLGAREAFAPPVRTVDIQHVLPDDGEDKKVADFTQALSEATLSIAVHKQDMDLNALREQLSRLQISVEEDKFSLEGLVDSSVYEALQDALKYLKHSECIAGLRIIPPVATPPGENKA